MASNVNHKHKETLTFNERVAAFIADLLGSPWAIYVFALISLSSLPGVLKSGDAVLMVQWLSGTFIQLVALAVLQAKAVIDGKHSEHMAEEMYRHMLYVEKENGRLHEKLDELCNRNTPTSRKRTSPSAPKRPTKPSRS